MKYASYWRWLACGFVALSFNVLADNAPLWLTVPGTNIITAPPGTMVELRAVADAVPQAQYFWLSNTVPIIGANTNFLWVTVSTTTTNAKWYVVATNNLGMSTNGPFTLRLSSSMVSNTWGNATLSGSNSVLDLIAIGNHITGAKPLTGVGLALADVNQDGVVNGTDQNLVQQDIMGRNPLAVINQFAVADSDGDSVPNWREWQQGLFQTSADSDGDGVDDATELKDGTDPLDPTSLIPYGTYSAMSQVTVFNHTPNPADSGVFVATPPVTITIQ
jgi:hypothetical protein